MVKGRTPDFPFCKSIVMIFATTLSYRSLSAFSLYLPSLHRVSIKKYRVLQCIPMMLLRVSYLLSD